MGSSRNSLFGRLEDAAHARKSVLLDLGRVRKDLNKLDSVYSCSAGSFARRRSTRGGAGSKELLPSTAIPTCMSSGTLSSLIPTNTELHRELAYLLLSMNQKVPRPSWSSGVSPHPHPEDLLSAAQLGFLYLARRENAAAMPLAAARPERKRRRAGEPREGSAEPASWNVKLRGLGCRVGRSPRHGGEAASKPGI